MAGDVLGVRDYCMCVQSAIVPACLSHYVTHYGMVYCPLDVNTKSLIIINCWGWREVPVSGYRLHSMEVWKRVVAKRKVGKLIMQHGLQI